MTNYWKIAYSGNITDYCSNITGILLIIKVILLFVAVLLNSKLNYLEITVRTLVTATKALILLSWLRSMSHSNVASPRSCLDKGNILVLVMSTRIPVSNQRQVLITDYLTRT
jgi:hypothetical protein